MNTNIKYINNIMNGVATIQMYDQIGDSLDENGNVIKGISGTLIANEIRYLNEVEKVEKINIRINSYGGSVMEGYSIISAMLSSKAPCDTYVDGLAASIAGVIAIAGKKCYMMDYSTLMLHNPFGEGVNDDILSYIKGTLVKIISQRTKRNDEEIAFMMDGETWLSASEAYKMGMVDEVISSAKEFKMEESVRKNIYSLVKVYNSIINQPTKQQMENTEKVAQLEAEIKNSTSENEALKSEIEALKSKLNAYEAEKAESEHNKAVELIENAIKDGKIDESTKEDFIKAAKIDFNVIKNTILSIETKSKKAVKLLDSVVKKDSERANWNIRDWEKKDPNGLTNMYKNDREEYNRLYNEYYKKTK